MRRKKVKLAKKISETKRVFDKIPDHEIVKAARAFRETNDETLRIV
jgi:hypothetical protein